MAKKLKKRRKAHHRLIPGEEEEAVKRCYENGEPVKEIARRFDIGWSTVSRIAGRNKLARRGNVASKRRLAAIRTRNVKTRMSAAGASPRINSGQ